MKAFFASMIFSSVAVLASSAAFAAPVHLHARVGSRSPKSTPAHEARPARSALPVETNVYGICHQECGPEHSSGGGLANKMCEDNCLARFCK